MTDDDLSEFEKGAIKKIEEYNAKKEGRPLERDQEQPSLSDTIGHKITLAVRNKEVSPDYSFSYESDKLSRVEAEIEAKKAPKKMAGV